IEFIANTVIGSTGPRMIDEYKFPIVSDEQVIVIAVNVHDQLIKDSPKCQLVLEALWIRRLDFLFSSLRLFHHDIVHPPGECRWLSSKRTSYGYRNHVQSQQPIDFVSCDIEPPAVSHGQHDFPVF